MCVINSAGAIVSNTQADTEPDLPLSLLVLLFLIPAAPMVSYKNSLWISALNVMDKQA